MAKNFNVPYILNGEFYEILSQEGESVTVRCCHCESRNIYKGSIRSTGNFHMHIKRKHPFLLPRVQEVKIKSYFHRKPQQKNKIEVLKVEHIRNMKCEEQSENVPSTVHTLENKKTLNAPGPSKQENVINVTEPPENLNRTSTTERLNAFTTDNLLQKLEEVLVRVESAMRGIEVELRLRNQVETNRLFLELAKFKYLHPHFTFNS